MPRSGRSPPMHGGSRIAAASTDATTQVLFVGPPGAGKSLLRRQLLRLARLHSGRMASHAAVARRRRQEALTGEPEDRRDAGPRTRGMLCGLCACFSSVSGGAGGERGSSVEDFGQTNRTGVGNGCSTAERVEVKGKPAARPSNGASFFAELVQRLANPSVSNLYPTLVRTGSIHPSTMCRTTRTTSSVSRAYDSFRGRIRQPCDNGRENENESERERPME